MRVKLRYSGPEARQAITKHNERESKNNYPLIHNENFVKYYLSESNLNTQLTCLSLKHIVISIS